jgi:hypothetical protein
MNCKEFHNNISPYLDNEIDNRNRELFESHYNSCQKCKALLGSYRLVDGTLSDIPVTTEKSPIEFKLKAKVNYKKTNSEMDILNLNPFRPAAAFAFTLLIILFSIYIFGIDNSNSLRISKNIPRNNAGSYPVTATPDRTSEISCKSFEVSLDNSIYNITVEGGGVELFSIGIKKGKNGYIESDFTGYYKEN